MIYNLKSIFIFILVLLFHLSGCSQSRPHEKVQNDLIFDTIHIKNKENMEKFDIESFNKNRESNTYTYTKSDGTIIIQRLIKDEFREEQKLINGYKQTYVFYPDGTLKIKGPSFYGILIGIWRYYDKNGTLIREENYDEPHKFSIDSLIVRMKEEDIDIQDRSRVFSINRSFHQEINNSLYILGILNKTIDDLVDYYFVDATNGEILYRTSRYQEEKNGGLIDEYIQILKKNNNK